MSFTGGFRTDRSKAIWTLRVHVAACLCPRDVNSAPGSVRGQTKNTPFSRALLCEASGKAAWKLVAPGRLPCDACASGPARAQKGSEKWG